MTLEEFLAIFITLVIYALLIYFVPFVGVFLGGIGLLFTAIALFHDDYY